MAHHKLTDVRDGIADDDERTALFALLEERPPLHDQRPGTASWSMIASEVSLRGSAVAVWNETHPLSLPGMEDPGGPLHRASTRLAEWRGADFDVVTVLDPQYPLALRDIHQIPPVLFVRGQLQAEEAGVSVVGSRTPTRRGLGFTSVVANGLVERGISVISGLATGIDTAAHHACLAAGGRPIGVLGTGINVIYPPENRGLHGRVAAAGALISQFMPDTPPTKQTFPMRNATMSGLGRASVIVQAGEYSGARIQARVAVEHGRPVILTDTVAISTRWGTALRSRPGVYVAASPAEVLDIVDDVVGDTGVPAAVLADPV